MKIIVKTRKNGTKRYLSVPEGPSKTDPSDKNMVDINNIMLQYQKTGLMPQFKEKLAQYMDTTQIPSYMDAQKQMSHARQLFMNLPSPIRKLMENNPANMEEFISNPDNEAILLKYKILESKEEPRKVEANPSPNPPSVDKNSKKTDDKSE